MNQNLIFNIWEIIIFIEGDNHIKTISYYCDWLKVTTKENI